MKRWNAVWALILLSACAPGPKDDFLPAARGPISGQLEEHRSRGQSYAVASPGTLASKAAEEIFLAGGNVADAAVATSFVISVERPHSTGLGGGGFLLHYQEATQESEAWDFREIAPARATKGMYLDSKGDVVPGLSLHGSLASGIPGLVKGLEEFHRKHGRLTWAVVLKPAIRAAREGYKVYPELSTALEAERATLEKFPETRAIFFGRDGTPLKEGELLVQKDLARTLEIVASQGSRAFYEGEIAQALLKSQQKWRGLWLASDLKDYKVQHREAVRGRFHGYDVLSMPPPSSGGVHMLQILNILEPVPLKKWGPWDARSVHYTAAAMQMAFADRAVHLGDPAFVKVPTLGLASPDYAKELRGKIQPKRALKQSEVSAGDPASFEPDHTVHFSLVDASGDAVASTQTINGWFGAGLVAEGTGILFNNEMDDFAAKPGVANLFGAVGGDANAVQAGKRPLSSMTPTIVLKGGKTRFVVGSPSGTRILTCVAMTLLNRIAYDMDDWNAVASLRYHHQWTPDELRVDEPGFPPALQAELEHLGYALKTNNLGCRVQLVSRQGKVLGAVSDPRGEGLALTGQKE